MRRNTLITLASLLILLVVLFSLRQTSRAPSESPAPFTFPTLEGVDHIEITAAEERVVLVRNEHRWMMREPVKDEVDIRFSERLDQLVSSKISVDFEAPGAAKPSSFGFTQPQTELALFRGDTQVFSAHLGAEQLVPETGVKRTFFRPAQTTRILRATEGLRSHLVRPSDRWRERQLFPDALGEFDRYTFSASDGTRYVIERRSDGPWTAPAHPRWTLDSAALGLTFGTLRRMQATAFVDDVPTAAHGFDNAATITVTAGELLHTVQLAAGRGELSGKFFARTNNDPQVYEIAPFTFENLAKPQQSFRSKVLLEVERGRVHQAKILPKAGQPHQLRVNQGLWQADTGDLPLRWGDILGELVSIEVERFAEPSAQVAWLGTILLKAGDDEIAIELGIDGGRVILDSDGQTGFLPKESGDLLLDLFPVRPSP